MAIAMITSVFAQTKIMPLGDSNTRGKSAANYRSYLRTMLINQANFPMNYVGSGVAVGGAHGPGGDSSTPYTRAEITALGNDLEHEGWGGYTIDGIRAGVSGWINTANPNMILLMIGTNDFNNGIGGGAIDRLDRLVGEILAQRPNVTLVVGSIPPGKGNFSKWARTVNDYNSQIPGLVNDYASEGYKIYFANIFPALNNDTDLVDSLHPTAGGYSKIAGAWYEVVSQLAVGNRQPQVTFTASGPQAAGYFVEGGSLSLTPQTFDADGTVARVKFFANGVQIGETSGGSSALVWPQVARGTYKLTAIAYDNQGFPGYSYPLDIRVGEPLPRAVLVVGGGGGVLETDFKIADSLSALGLEPEIYADEEVSGGVGEAELIVISSTVSSSKVGAAFKNSTIPVITCEPFLFDDMGLTAGVRGVDFELTSNQTSIQITNDLHPLAGGLGAGLNPVVSNGQGFFSWGRPAGSVFSVGHLPGFPDRSAIFGIETGGLLFGGQPAAGRRVGLFLGDFSATNFTTAGQSVLDAAIVWALDGAAGGPIGGGENVAPRVGVDGGDRFLESQLPASTTLNAWVLDDGKPLGNPLVVGWSAADAAVSFANPASPSTEVTFSASGSFVLTVTASDGELSATKDVTVTVVDPNGPPAGLVYSSDPAVYELGQAITPNTPSSFGAAVSSYSIDPPLPAGLEFDTATGIISGTPTEGAAIATYVVTASNAQGSTAAQLVLTVQLPPAQVLLVVGQLTLSAGDSAIYNWFLARRFVVSLSTLTEVQAANAVGKDLIVITATGVSGSLGGRLRDVAVPTIVCEPYLFGSMGMTGVASNAALGNSNGETQLEILEPAHPLAAGLEGTVDAVTSGSGFFGWGIPNANAISIAALGSNSLRSGLFAYDRNSPLVNGTPAPHRRLGMFLGDLTAANLTARGWSLFEAGVQWALVGGGFGPGGAPLQLTYSKSSAVYPLGEPITPNIPALRGGIASSYSIAPELPAGLLFDNVTGVISGTPTESRFTTVYHVTAASSAGPVSKVLTISVPGEPLGEVLLVVGNLTLNAGDLAIRNWFEAAGYIVRLRSLSAVQVADTVGKKLVMITSTGSSTEIGARLRDVQVATIVCEAFIFDDMGLTSGGDGVAQGVSFGESRIGIFDPLSPLAAGLSGTVDAVMSSDGFFAWGAPSATAMTIATLGSDASRSAIFAYETGSLMASGQAAPQRRLGMFMGDVTAANFTAAGWQIFTACVQWAIEGTQFDENGPPALLRYSTNPCVYVMDQQITPNVPSSEGGPVDNYSITPALPAGLSFDTVTGTLSGTPQEMRPATNYQVTASNLMGSTTATLSIAVTGPPLGDVLLVVGSLVLSSGDAALRDWFLDAGYAVTMQSFAAVQPADTVDKDLVMITATGISSEIGGRLTNVAVPMIVCESFIFDDMGLTGGGDGIQLGSTFTQSRIQIARPEHPLAAGLTGLVTAVSDDAGYFTWGVPAGDGLKIATLASDTTRSTVFAYESGGLLANGLPAAHRRLGLFLGDFTAANFTAAGSRLFAASVQWTINGTGFDTNGPPVQMTYSSDPAVYNVNVPIIPNVPSSLGGNAEGYSIIPTLPEGLNFDSLTGLISGTPTVSSAPMDYQVTAFNQAGSTTAKLNISILNGQLPKVLLVVGSLTLNPGDAAINSWFDSAGYAITLKTLSAVQASDTLDQDIVVITATGSAGQIGSRLSDVSVPVIVCEPYIFGQMGMTLSGNDVDMGISMNETQVNVVTPGHPLSAGLVGLTTVATTGTGFFPWGVPGSEAVRIANLASDPSRSALFAYEAGSFMPSGLPAPSRRIGLFLGDLTAANFTPQGLQLFTAAVEWAYDGRNFDPDGAPARLGYSRNRAIYSPGVQITPNVPSVLGGPVQGFGVSPALPPGLVLDPLTGVISGTPTEVREEAFYRVTAFNQFGVTTSTISITVSNSPPDVLLVVGSLTLGTGDVALRNWFQAAGYVVTLRTFATVQPADTFRMELVFISATGSAAQIGARLRDVAVPVIVCDPGVLDDMGMTAVDQLGTATNQSQISINVPTHPLAAGLSGLATVIGSGGGQAFTWGIPGGDALNVASLSSASNRSVLFAYESGSRLASGQVAPQRRLGLFLSDLTASRLNTAGLNVLQASVDWAVRTAPPYSLPSGLRYATDPSFYDLGVAITPNIPTNNGGTRNTYSVAPPLPGGLILNPTTGVISGTPLVVQEQTRYQVTASNSEGSSSTTLTLSVTGPGDMLLVVGNATLNAGDRAIRDWFVARGYRVNIRTLALVQAADATGSKVVVITSTGTSGQIGSRLRNVSVPVVVCEPYSFGNMGMTLPGDNVQMGISMSGTQVDVVGNGHPLAAGLSGLTTVVNSGDGFLPWGVPGNSAVKIATVANDPVRAHLFAYELGSPMASGQLAPARRVGLFLGDLTAANLTAQGQQLISAAFLWALAEPVFDQNGPPVQLRYATNPAVYPLDVRITPNLPSSLGGPVTNFSISPALPVGLVLNPSTGIISGKPKVVKPPTTYLVTATNGAGSTTVELPLSIQGPPPGDVLLVVGNLTLNTGDAAIRNWFLAGGYTVTLRTLSAVQAADTVGMELVLITSTGTSGQIGTRLRDVPVPVIVCEPFAFGNMGLTLPGDNVQMGFSSGETQLNVNASSHPLSAGLGGLQTITNSNSGFFGWGIPGAQAFNIATLGSNASRSALFAYDSGSPLASGVLAPHRRLGMFMGDVTAANFTLEGSWIFAAAVDWAINGIVLVEPDPFNPPSGLSYPTTTAAYRINTPVTPNIPSSQGGAIQSYTINPALPAGLAFDTTTGVITGTPTELTAAAAYQVTGSNVDGTTSVTLTISVTAPPPPPQVMLVVGSLTLNTGDSALRNWFLTRGYVVTLRTFAAVQAADATDKDLVFVSSTGSSGQLGGRLTNVAVPVIVCESAVFDDMGLTGVTDGVHYGSLNTQSQIQIVNSSHPLAAGLSGLTTVVGNSAGFFQWGVPGAAAVNVATLATAPTRSALFAYESGSLLASGQPAAHRRLGLFLGDFTAANFNASGSQVFEACVTWAVGPR